MARSRIPDRLNALEDAIEIRTCELLLERMMPWIAHRLGMSVEQAQLVKEDIRADVFPPVGISLNTWKHKHLQPLSESALEQGNELLAEFAEWEAEQGRAA